MSEIAEAAFQYQVALEKGEKKVVGVNCHTESVSHELEILRVSHEVEREQVATLAQRKAARDEAAVRAAVQHLVEVSRTHDNMVPAMLDAGQGRSKAGLGRVGRLPGARPLIATTVYAGGAPGCRNAPLGAPAAPAVVRVCRVGGYAGLVPSRLARRRRA